MFCMEQFKARNERNGWIPENPAKKPKAKGQSEFPLGPQR